MVKLHQIFVHVACGCGSVPVWHYVLPVYGLHHVLIPWDKWARQYV